MKDTIFALATPPGIRGIGVIKISGPEAKKAVEKLFVGKRNPLENPREMVLGEIVDPFEGTILDKALVVYMPGPRSYTGEDVVEIQAHGGLKLLEAIMEILQKLGFRAAKGGEFTLRAFLNGKMDLTQAEAVLSLVHAKSKKAVEISSRILEGELKKRVEELRENLKEALVELEPQLDFPEEEIVYNKGHVLSRIDGALKAISRLLSTYKTGRILTEGAVIVICGSPNVGKSSIFNRLVGRDRAIVTPIPGTTRDYIEETLLIGSIPVKVIDTAGIREVMDPVEKEGVERAKEKIDKADMILFVIDLSRDVSPQERRFLEKIKDKEHIVVGNKLDIAKDIPEWIDIAVSAKTGERIDELKRMIEDKLVGGDVVHEDIVLLSSRQKFSLERARGFLEKARERIEGDGELDLAAEDIKGALKALSELVGEVAPEEVLNTIFDRFCIGK